LGKDKRHKIIFRIIISIIYCSGILLPSGYVFAHKVNLFAYAEGDTVCTESYFSDGKRIQGGKIEIFDTEGNKVLEGLTDSDGQFKFRPPVNGALKIVLNASMGHRDEYILAIDEPQSIKVPQKVEDRGVFINVLMGLSVIFSLAGILYYVLIRRKSR